MTSVDVTQTPSSSNSEVGAGTGSMPVSGSGGNSCGESNPSTGYNSTTGGGTPEHHSLGKDIFTYILLPGEEIKRPFIWK